MQFRRLLIITVMAPACAIPFSQANALSCARPDIVRSFKQWSQSEKEYVLVRGTLEPMQAIPKLPKTTDINNPPDPPAIEYRFSGATIGASGNKSWQGNISVDPYCLAAWCGGYPQTGIERIMALEANKNSYILGVGPCPGESYFHDLDAVETALRACLSGNCPPEGPIRGD